MSRFDQPIEPMTLGNMRGLGVRSLDVSCWNLPATRSCSAAAAWPMRVRRKRRPFAASEGHGRSECA
jgi:hypothetical protein